MILIFISIIGSFHCANFAPVLARDQFQPVFGRTEYKDQQEAIGDEPEFKECDFLNCTAAPTTNGGAIYSLTQTKLYVQECTFVNCISQGFGGAVYFHCADTAKFNLDDSSFKSCTAKSGGAVHVFGMISFKGNSFSNCKAEANGSHVYIEYIYVDSKIKETNFSYGHCGSDTQESYGGSVYIQRIHNELKFSDCRFDGNEAKYGGAVAFGYGQDKTMSPVAVLFDHCNFSRNTGTSAFVNRANDIFAEAVWEYVLTAGSFFVSKSTSSLPMVYVEGVGDKSSWLGGSNSIPKGLLWWIYFAIAAGVFIVIFLPVIICCCFCCGCACFAASAAANQKDRAYVTPATTYQAHVQQQSLYGANTPQKL